MPMRFLSSLGLWADGYVVAVNQDGSDIALGYPSSSTPLAAGSGNVANASAVATLTGSATTTVYCTGFEVTGAGATAGLPVIVTVAGLLGGTRSYIYVFEAGVLVGNKPLAVQYAPPLPASAVNTAIVVTCPAGGAGNTNNAVVAHGFHK
jgi:hypothetical protein